MSIREQYPAGVPCWVETLLSDPRAATTFYRSLLGWEFSEPEPMAGGLGGEYYVAHVDGHAVAGIGTLPPLGGPPTAVWSTSIRVESADRLVELATTAGASVMLGPLAVGSAGRWAVLVDPTGAAFGAWEACDREGAQLVNQPGTWTMSALHTPDPTAAATFYGAVFGWEAEPIAAEAPVTVFRLAGYIGGEPGQPIPRDVVAVMTATASGPNGPSVPPHWNVNLRVDDSDAIAARAAELGGTLLMGPMDTPGFRSAVLMDPQGAAFSVSHIVRGK
ncbi:MAG: VOC family protein [Actinomycetota bacterium]|nr:VOC family protein [Actinomycetota bacterium]